MNDDEASTGDLHPRAADATVLVVLMRDQVVCGDDVEDVLSHRRPRNRKFPRVAGHVARASQSVTAEAGGGPESVPTCSS